MPDPLPREVLPLASIVDAEEELAFRHAQLGVRSEPEHRQHIACLHRDERDYSGAGGGIAVNLAVTTGQVTGQGTDIFTGIERVIGSFGGDSIIGNDQDNWIFDVSVPFQNTGDYYEGGAGIDTDIGSWDL